MIVVIGSKTLDLSQAFLTNCTLDNGIISISAKGSRYYQTGTIEFRATDLGGFFMEVNTVIVTTTTPSGATCVVSTSTSSDGNTFEAYKPLNMDNSITSTQGRYIRIKIVLTAPTSAEVLTLNDFVQGETARFETNNFIEFVGDLKLKTSYTDQMTKDETWTDGQLFTCPINKTQFKKIDSIGVV